MSDEHRLLFFIDPIESSSYPVTETGYALLYRAFTRALAEGGEVWVAYPDAPFSVTVRAAGTPEVRVTAQRVLAFDHAPYEFYRSQRDRYRADVDVGSPRCHREDPSESLLVNQLDAVVWRQETGRPAQTRALLRALQTVEPDTLIYLGPHLALDPRFGSKVIPERVDRRFVPRSFHTDRAGASASDKAEAALTFVREQLHAPDTVIVKPLDGNNGIGIHVLGVHPVSGRCEIALSDRQAWISLLERYGDLVVQEYLPSVRAPHDLTEATLASVPHDCRDFGEIRFLLIDGEVPHDDEGKPCLVARRVPAADSLVADSGISHPSSLSPAELSFLAELGPLYRRWGIYFGGGDLIRTGDPARPFVFTDAARSVCGHAVVTGALNGRPYLIVDRVLDSLRRHIAAHRAGKRSALTLVREGEASVLSYAEE